MSNYLVHSAKGTTWKDHKYIRKDGDRYVYVDTKSKPLFSVSGDHNDAKKETAQKTIDEYNQTLERIDDINATNLDYEYKKREISFLRERLKELERTLRGLEIGLHAPYGVDTYSYDKYKKLKED